MSLFILSWIWISVRTLSRESVISSGHSWLLLQLFGISSSLWNSNAGELFHSPQSLSFYQLSSFQFYRKSNIEWECANGGQIWTSSSAYANGSSLPSGFCTTGFSSLNAAWIVSLLVDLVFQVSVNEWYIAVSELSVRACVVMRERTLLRPYIFGRVTSSYSHFANRCPAI